MLPLRQRRWQRHDRSDSDDGPSGGRGGEVPASLARDRTAFAAALSPAHALRVSGVRIAVRGSRWQ